MPVSGVFVCARCPSELQLSASSRLKVEEVEEGSEPAEFWKALGQQDKKAYDCMLQGTAVPTQHKLLHFDLLHIELAN